MYPPPFFPLKTRKDYFGQYLVELWQFKPPPPEKQCLCFHISNYCRRRDKNCIMIIWVKNKNVQILMKHEDFIYFPNMWNWEFLPLYIYMYMVTSYLTKTFAPLYFLKLYESESPLTTLTNLYFGRGSLCWSFKCFYSLELKLSSRNEMSRHEAATNSIMPQYEHNFFSVL